LCYCLYVDAFVGRRVAVDIHHDLSLQWFQMINLSMALLIANHVACDNPVHEVSVAVWLTFYARRPSRV